METTTEKTRKKIIKDGIVYLRTTTIREMPKEKVDQELQKRIRELAEIQEISDILK